MIVDAGIILIEFWLEVGKDEQEQPYAKIPPARRESHTKRSRMSAYELNGHSCAGLDKYTNRKCGCRLLSVHRLSHGLRRETWRRS